MSISMSDLPPPQSQSPPEIDYNNDNTIIFTIARMNPPTPGHLLLIKELINEAIKKKVNDVYVILSKTESINENPIACPDKIDVLGNPGETAQTMINTLKHNMKKEAREKNDTTNIDAIDQVNVHLICVTEGQKTPYGTLDDLVLTDTYRKNDSRIPKLHLFLIIGDDREDMLDSIAKTFLTRKNKVYSVDGTILRREKMADYKKDVVKEAIDKTLGSYDLNKIPIEAMSASIARILVRNKDKFTELYSNYHNSRYLDQDKIDELYEKVLKGVDPTISPAKTSTSPPKKKETVNGEPYKYPMIRGILPITPPKSDNPPKAAATKRKLNTTDHAKILRSKSVPIIKAGIDIDAKKAINEEIDPNIGGRRLNVKNVSSKVKRGNKRVTKHNKKKRITKKRPNTKKTRRYYV